MRWFWALGAIVMSAGPPAQAENIVVLPFFNQSGDASLDWIGESIAESARDALAAYGIMPLDRADRLEAYRRLGIRERALLTRATVMKIGEALDADQILFGEFQVSSGTLKIAANLLDLRRLRRGPEFSETGALEDLAALQTHMAWQALKFWAPKTAPSESAFRKQQVPVRLDAVENYMRGLLATSPEQKQRFFTQASQLDARFSPPCFQLGQLYYQRKEYNLAAGWLEKVSSADVHFRQANFLLGLARFQTGDYAAAQKAWLTVAQAVPLNEVYNNLGAAQSRLNLPQALASFRRALEGDRADPVYHFNVGYALYKRGDWAAAAERFRAVLDRDPDDAMATLMLGRCLKPSSARPSAANADTRTQGLERLKTNYEERAYWQLKAMVEAKQ